MRGIGVRRARRLAALAVTFGLLAPVPAGAAPKPPCSRLIEDPAGDVSPVGAGPLPYGHVDLRYGGVVFSRDHLHVVIGVEDLSDDDGYWRIHLNIGRAGYRATATRDAFWRILHFEMYDMGSNDPRLKGVIGVFDEARDEVRIQVPLSSFGKHPPRKGRTPMAVEWMGADATVFLGRSTVFEDTASAWRPPAC